MERQQGFERCSGDTLPETNSSHLKLDGKGILYSFPFGTRPIFRCLVSGSVYEDGIKECEGKIEVHPRVKLMF